MSVTPNASPPDSIIIQCSTPVAEGEFEMNAITQIITQQLGGSAARTIAQRLGVSETTANTAMQIR
jgi:hypothetical protein